MQTRQVKKEAVDASLQLHIILFWSPLHISLSEQPSWILYWALVQPLSSSSGCHVVYVLLHIRNRSCFRLILFILIMSSLFI